MRKNMNGREAMSKKRAGREFLFSIGLWRVGFSSNWFLQQLHSAEMKMRKEVSFMPNVMEPPPPFKKNLTQASCQFGAFYNGCLFL